MSQSENSNQITANDDDEISLIDLLAVLLKYKKMIIGVTVFAMVFAVVISIISLILPPEKSFLPNEYTPKALMLINDSSSSGGSLSSMLSSSGLGSLASLAGISSSGGSTYSSLATYFATTNTFLDSIVDEFNLIEKWEIKKSPRANSRKLLKESLIAEFDDDSGVFSISFTDIDPEFAKSVVNYAVKLMENMFLDLGIDKNLLEKKNLEQNITNTKNEILRLQRRTKQLESSVSYGASASTIPEIMTETQMVKLELEAQQQVYTQLKTQQELLKIKMASDTPVFQIIEEAEIPDQKSGPSRGKLCIIITFAAIFISIFLAFALNAVQNIKNDREAMQKIKSGWNNENK